ncbi:MAG: glycosyltransferase family 4 protein [candidate division Zixibacteria bacterium]|jgi:glycosyltransferase involved in cell wall biosynthesis|nr:glycosyltransferase family 4 protein [candidate division Zixibacteria bacterium]
MRYPIRKLPPLDDLKVAIVHEWLINYSGAERVVEQLLAIFPQADLFAQVDFLPEELRGFISHKPVTTSFIQRLPGARKHYRSYLPLMPLAVEQFDLTGYDLVISNNHAVAKGVITGPDQIHISYVQSPIRYAWDLTHQYLRESGLDRGLRGWVAKLLLHRIRTWDARAANGVDRFVGNSGFIARRIAKAYRREADVIYPPVDVASFSLREQKDDYFLAASRLVPYKKIDLIVEAFASLPDRKLVVIGDGPDMAKIAAKAGPNVRILGYQPFEVLRDYMQRARAFVFAATEDFGIIPVEAQACGTPVIAFGRGGATETVVHGQTGVFFEEQTVASLVDAVREFDRLGIAFEPAIIRNHALQFSVERFQREFRSLVIDTVESMTGMRRQRALPPQETIPQSEETPSTPSRAVRVS